MATSALSSVRTAPLAAAPAPVNVAPEAPAVPTVTPPAPASPKVVAMILAYNCAHLLPRAISRIPPHLVSGMFITDDGSEDETPEVAAKLNVPYIRHTPNRGYGGNVKAGLQHAISLGADYVVEIHGDGAQFDPAAIALALPLMADQYDLILGSRFQDPAQALANGMPLIRYLANRGLSFFDQRVLGLPLTEFHTGFRIYRRAWLETVPYMENSDDYLFSFEIIAQAAYTKAKVAEVPVEADYKSEHTSHKLTGATIYAIETFAILGAYLLARAGLFHFKQFPARPFPAPSS